MQDQLRVSKRIVAEWRAACNFWRTEGSENDRDATFSNGSKGSGPVSIALQDEVWSRLMDLILTKLREEAM
jgi:hypothetical protein